SFSIDTKYGVEALAVASDGDTLAVVAAGRVDLWRLSTGKKIRALLPTADVRAVAFSPDRKTVALGVHSSTGGSVCLLDVQTGKVQRRLDGFASSLSFSPDGRRLATAGAHSAVLVWDVQTGRQVLPAGGPVEPAGCLAFDRGGKTLVSAED